MTNYFEFYELPISPKVDETLLRKRFLELSKRFHPDFYTLESPEKQAEVLELSTLNNQAYQVLSDFDLRLKHLLELKQALADEGQNQLPQSFLMEMMDINELVMELSMDDSPALLEQALAQTAALEKSLWDDISASVDLYDDQTVSAETLENLKNFFLKKRYLLRIKENVLKFAPH